MVQGSPFIHQTNAAAGASSQGPAFLHQPVAVLTLIQGPALVQSTVVGAPASSHGPSSDAFLTADPQASVGPIFDHNTATVPTSSVGAVSDSFVSHDPDDSIGTLFDHTIEAIPPGSSGPVSDTFIGIPAAIIHGPVFDHEVMAILGGLPAHGPVSDEFLSPSISYHGPVFDHIISAPPPLLAVLDPDTVSPPPRPRNKLQPKPIDFLSPKVYGLEKDEDGNVTGNKF